MNNNRFKAKQLKPTYALLGIVWGASFGFIFGLLFFKDYFPVFIGIEGAAGLIIGTRLDSREKDRQTYLGTGQY
jgi:uncharacterized membrane protein